MAEFEMKNRCKSAEEAKGDHCHRGLGPAAGGQLGFGDRAPCAAAILQLFIQKIHIFRHILVYISA